MVESREFMAFYNVGGSRMPFGKYKGTEVCDITDIDYLCWLLSNIDVKEPLKQEIIDHIEANGIIITDDMLFDPKRGKLNNGTKPKFDNSKFQSSISYLNPDTDMKKLLVEFVDLGYKRMAMKYHPDKGGTKEDMQAINDLKDWLVKGLEL